MAITIYGFDASTYVRTVRMLLADKGAQYDLVPVNVLGGECKAPEHLARNPFGKVPVLDHDGLRIIETSAITQYLDAVLPGPSLVPASPRDRARMHTTMGVVDSYGYGALIGIAAFHLFPDFVGGANEAHRQDSLRTGRLVLTELMKLRGHDDFIAGAPSLADYYLAPICTYVAMTPDAADLFATPGFAAWWDRVQALPAFQATPPTLG